MPARIHLAHRAAVGGDRATNDLRFELRLGWWPRVSEGQDPVEVGARPDRGSIEIRIARGAALALDGSEQHEPGGELASASLYPMQTPGRCRLVLRRRPSSQRRGRLVHQ